MPSWQNFTWVPSQVEKSFATVHWFPVSMQLPLWQRWRVELWAQSMREGTPPLQPTTTVPSQLEDPPSQLPGPQHSAPPPSGGSTQERPRRAQSPSQRPAPMQAWAFEPMHWVRAGQLPMSQTAAVPKKMESLWHVSP